MDIRTLLATATLALLPLAALAQQRASIGIELVAPGKYAGSFEEKATASVLSVDESSRSLVLQRANGAPLIVFCGEDIRNFSQIKANDKVVSRHLIALEMELKKGGNGISKRIDTHARSFAQANEKPAAYAAQKVAFVANVQNVDVKKRTLTLKGAKYTFDLVAKDPAQLAQIRKGDRVEGSFIKADAIEIEATPGAGK